MNYKDAFKIGSKCDGYAKGTYAGIYIKERGNWYEKIFSIQKTSVSQEKTPSIGVLNIKTTIFDKEKNLSDFFADVKYSDVKVTDSSNGADVILEYDLPIVVAERFVDNSSFIPVTLTEYGIEAIVEGLKKINVTDGTVTKRKYSVYMRINGTIGKRRERTAVRKTIVKGTYKVPEIKFEDGYQKLYLDGELYGMYETSDNLEIEYEDVPQPKYDGLIESLTTLGIVYVKPNTLDWEATNINNTSIEQNGVQLNLNNALEDARKRMETAKALLATAATLTII